MKRTLIAAALVAALPMMATAQTAFKETLSKYFLIGAAVDTTISRGHNPAGEEVIRKYYNQIVPENCMKGENIHPEENRYDFADADKLVAWGEANGQTVTGHCLVWHSQPPKWMFTDENGKTVSRAVLIDRMYHHITTVVSHFKGRIKGWDVINEAFNDDGTYRETPYYKIIGEDYFELAFQFAHEADPNCELYYNDYSMALPAKRDAVIRLVKRLQSKGIRIDGVGLQSHHGFGHPDLNEWEKTIEQVAATGVKVMLTELDLNMLPNPQNFSGAEVSQNFAYDKALNPYAKGLTKKAQKVFDDRYMQIFEIVKRHKDVISRVTFWGVYDGNSWLNDWPVPGRTNYPLPFDRQYKPKPIVDKITKLFAN